MLAFLLTAFSIIIVVLMMIKVNTIKTLKLLILSVLYMLDICLSFIIFVYSIVFYLPYMQLTSSNDTKKEKEKSKHIVIIGYSVAGFEIHKHLQNTSLLESYTFTVIEPKEFFEYTPAILDIMCAPSKYNHISFPLSQCFDSTRSILIQGKAISIDNELNSILIENFTNKCEETIKFDYCFICTGSKYAEPIKVNIDPVINDNIHYNIREQQFKDLYHTLDCDCREQGHDCYIGIIGAGPVGIEIMSAIVEEFPLKKVMLIDMAPTICGPFPKSTQNYIRKWIDKRKNITVKLNAKIVNFRDILKPSKTGYTLKIENSDKTIDSAKFDLIFRCAGFKPNSQILFNNKQFENTLTEKFRFIKVDDWMRVINNKSIFAAGDVIDQPHINEVKLAHTAEIHAMYLNELMCYIHCNNNKNVESTFIPYHEWLFGKKIIMTTSQSNLKGKKLNMPLVFTINLGKSDGSMGYGNVYLNGVISVIVKWFIEVSMCKLYQRKSIWNVNIAKKKIFKLYPIGYRMYNLTWKAIHAFTIWYIKYFNK